MLSIILAGTICLGIGAATGIKINAELKQQRITVNGKEITKQVVTYQDTIYVPLRDFANMLGTHVDYKDGTIYVEGNSSAIDGNISYKTNLYDIGNPAPVGITQKITFNKGKDIYSAEVCLKKVIRGEAAWEKIKVASASNEEAPTGMEYILANISVKAIKVPNDKKLEVSPTHFAVYSHTKYENPSVVVPEPSITASLCAGESIEGWIAFTVNESDSFPKLAYEDSDDGTSGIWFSLQ